jgi:tRNA nucleotidyltransferase/poly(A) polymerase/nanoRNase/pAp phosphatase (c-di-AMP/oligoRNAs hydrolase)
MELIVSHSNADMDSLAAMAAASKIYPEAKLVFADSPDPGVRDFLAHYGQWLHLTPLKDIPLHEVKKLIIVDTREARRLGDLRVLIENPEIELHVYDHHPTTYRDIVGDYNCVRQVGSTTTLLIELIQEKKLPVSPEEATLFLAGIYADTGSLSFPRTTASDLNAAAWLLEKGGDLKIVTEHLNRTLSPEQRDLLNRLLLSLQFFQIKDQNFLITKASVSYYANDASLLTQRILDLEKTQAAFSLIQMQGRIFLIARSASKTVNAAAICEEFGGGGHETAASASLKENNLEKVEEKLLLVLKNKIESSDLQQAPQPPQNQQGSQESVETLHLKDWKSVPKAIAELLKEMGKLADDEQINLFVVGGFVRDLMLGIENLDLDLVVEGDGISFAKKMAGVLKADLTIHEPFKTAVLILPDQLRIDLATARSEFYARPAALPEVASTTLKQDLTRRDFSINAMALKLNPNDFGRLIDFFGGQRDLQHGIIRVLHSSSFMDDPTRIFRAIRYEQRYGFHIESHTEKLLKEAIYSGVLSKLSRDRIRNEIILLLSEKNPIPAIQRIGKLKGLSLIHPSLRLSGNSLQILKQIPEVLAAFRETLQIQDHDIWIIYALGLFCQLTPEEIEELLMKWKFPLQDSQKISFLKSNWEKMIHELSHSVPKTPSEIFQKLEKIPSEGLVFCMAYSRNPFLKERIEQYALKFQKMKLFLSGEDLKALGVQPGPIYKEWLAKVKNEQMDGNIQTREQALEFLKKNLKASAQKKD